MNSWPHCCSFIWVCIIVKCHSPQNGNQFGVSSFSTRGEGRYCFQHAAVIVHVFFTTVNLVPRACSPLATTIFAMVVHPCFECCFVFNPFHFVF